MLASSFAEKVAQRMGRTIAPLSLSCIRRLKSYDWPGNIREVQNVIERAVITSRDGTLNLERALPETTEVQNEAMQISDKILTLRELQTWKEETSFEHWMQPTGFR